MAEDQASAPGTSRAITLARFFQYVLERSQGEFYGTLHVQFRRGQIVIVRPEQTFAADDELPVVDEQAVTLMRTGRYHAAVAVSGR